MRLYDVDWLTVSNVNFIKQHVPIQVTTVVYGSLQIRKTTIKHCRVLSISDPQFTPPKNPKDGGFIRLYSL